MLESCLTRYVDQGWLRNNGIAICGSRWLEDAIYSISSQLRVTLSPQRENIKLLMISFFMNHILGFYSLKCMILTKENLHIMRDTGDIGRVNSEKIMHHLESCENSWSICNIISIWFTGVIFFSIDGFSDGIKEFFISISIIIHKTNNGVISSTFIEIVEAFCDSIFCDIEAL